MAKQNSDNGKFSSSDEKRASKMAKLMSDMQKSGYDFSKDFEKSDTAMNSISNAIFGVNSSEFYSKIKESSENIAKMAVDVAKYSDAVKEATNDVNKGFINALNSARAKGIKVNETISLMTNELSKKMPEIAKQIQDAFDTKNLASLSSEAMKQFQKIVKDKDGFGKLHDFFETDAVKDLKALEGELKQTQAKLAANGTEVFNLGKGLEQIGKNFAKNISPQKIVDTLTSFDDKLSDIQRKFGVTGGSIRKTSESMSSLVSNGAQFGMSTEESFKNVEQLANSLKTNNIPAVAELAKQFQEIPGALGATNEEVYGIVGSMKFLGDSTEDIKNMFTNIAKTSAVYGVNVSKVTSEIAKELPRWQKMGFKGAEDSLVRVIAKTEKLGISMDSVMNATDKFQLNMESSLDAASQLQLVGGSFANTNPFDLMSAAASGPEAMTDLIGKMGADIGEFNKNGEFKINPVDRKRLSMASEALGITLGDMTNMISQAAIKNKKIDLLGSTLQGLTPDEQEFVTNLSNIGKDGKIKLDIGGVTDLSKLTPQMIKTAMEKSKADADDLKARNIANQSMKQSFDSFVSSLLSALTVFEPVLKVLGSIMNGITKAFNLLGDHTITKAIVALTAALFFAFGGNGFVKLAKALHPANMLESIKSFAKNGFKGEKTFTSKSYGMNKLKGTENMTGKSGDGIRGFLTGLAGGLKEFASGKVFLGAVILAASTVLLGAAIAGVAYMLSLVPISGLIEFGVGIIALATSMFIMSKIAGKISTAGLVEFGADLIIFAVELSIAMILAVPAIAIFIGSMIGLSYAFKLVGEGLGAMAPAITAILEGIGTVIKDIGTSISTVITSISDSILKLSNIPGENLFVLAGGILALSGAMVAFGIGSVIGGIGSLFGGGMFAELEKIGMIAPMISLAATSINSMAEGVEKLNSAVKSLDTAKLESLASSSERLSVASAISGLSNAVFGGSTGKSDNTQTVQIAPITIDLKVNGRFLQQLIIDDSKLSS